MHMEGALTERLLAAAAITDVVSDRVNWVERPQGDSLPAITLQIVVDPREQHMKGFQGYQRATVQIDVWATSYEEGKALKEAIIQTLVPDATVENVKFDRAFVTARDLSEATATQFIHRPSMDFTINYATE